LQYCTGTLQQGNMILPRLTFVKVACEYMVVPEFVLQIYFVEERHFVKLSLKLLKFGQLCVNNLSCSTVPVLCNKVI
jgi:hypothetical protein